MAWQTTADGHHCVKHDVTFARGDVCQQCITDPPPRISVTSEEENEHDRELAIRESELMTVARQCFRVGKTMLEGTGRDCVAAAKVLAEGTKAMRFASEFRNLRAQREESRRKREHHREVLGMRKGN